MMNKKRVALTLALTGLLSSVASGFALQGASSNHFLQLKFNLAVGQSRVLPLSKTPKDCPITISVTVTNIVEDGVPSRPILLMGWVVRDSVTAKVSAKGFGGLSPLSDCSFFNDQAPPGTFVCGLSDGERLLVWVVLRPDTGELVIYLTGSPAGGLASNEFPVCVNMSF